MALNAADPAVLHTTNPGDKRHIAKPNRITVANDTWTVIPIGLPSVVLFTTGAAGTVVAVPDKVAGDPIGQNEVYTAIKLSDTSYLFYFHAPGNWRMRSTAAGTAIVIDANDGILPILLTLRAVGIAGSGGVADVRDADANADFAATLLGLEMNGRLSLLRLNTNAWERWNADTPNQANGIPAANPVSAHTIAHVFGRDSGTPTVVAVEARTLTSWDGVAGTTVMLGACNAPLLLDPTGGGSFSKAIGLRETTGVAGLAQSQLSLRRSGYWGGVRGRRFTLCLPATVVAQSGSSFSATAPVLLFVAPATNEWIIRKVRIHWYDPITVATTRVRFVIDPDNRYSSGGVSMTPTGGFKSTSRGSAGAALTPTQARYNDGITAIVATAADDDEYGYGDIPAEDTEGETIWTPDDDSVVPPSGSILGYVWDGGGTEFTVQVELESANVE